MKNNSLKVLLLSALMVGTMTGCGTPSESANSSQTPSEDKQESNSIENTQSEEVSESETAEPSESESSAPVIATANARVSLDRRIYLRSELDEKVAAGQNPIELTSFEVWSKILKGWKEVSAAYSITVPAGVGRLDAIATAGAYSVAFGIEVYDTIEQAVDAHKISADELANIKFQESLYYSRATKKMKDNAYHTVDDEGNLSFYYNTVKQVTQSVDDSEGFTTLTNYNWATKKLYVFSDGDKNTTQAVLDSTRKAAPHQLLNSTYEYSNANGLPVLVEKSNEVNYSRTYSCNSSAIDITAYDGLKKDDIGNANAECELIVDAEGNICYLGLVSLNSNYVSPALVEDSWYCSPKYQSNDYSTVAGAKANTNPAFLFADDYNPDDENGKYKFEKVIPEGGYHFVQVNNYSGYSGEAGFGSLDFIWKFASGCQGNVFTSQTSITKEVSYENETLNNSRILFQNGKINGLTFQNAISLYQPADTYHIYAYLLYKTNDTAKADEIVEAIKYQQAKISAYGRFNELPEEADGPLSLDYYNANGTLASFSISEEPLLFNYYSEGTKKLLADWAKVLLN